MSQSQGRGTVNIRGGNLKKIGSPEIAGLTQDQLPVRTLNPEAYNFKHGEQKIAKDIFILEYLGKVSRYDRKIDSTTF